LPANSHIRRGWRTSRSGRRLDAQVAEGDCGGVARLGGQPGHGRQVARMFGRDHQLRPPVQDLAGGTVEQQPAVVDRHQPVAGLLDLTPSGYLWRRRR
jgi:hypothetical protein